MYSKIGLHNSFKIHKTLSLSTLKTYFYPLTVQRPISHNQQSRQNMANSSNKELFEVRAKDDLLNHLFEESAALNVYDKSILNLAAGAPGPDLLSSIPDLMKESLQHRMSSEVDNNYYLFQYGPTAGLWGMRKALSEFLTKKYGSQVNREDLVLSCGATQGLHLCLSSLLVPNGIIFVEEYTYMIALQLFREFPNFKIVEIPMTESGVDIEKLYTIAKGLKDKGEWNVSDYKPFWALFYTIPNFHNPTSILLPPEKCKSLVEVARKLDMVVVCDDVYNLLYYGDDENPPARLFSYDDSRDENYKGGNVISNGSFSKILAPGFRVGWIEAPQRVVTKLKQSGILQSGGSVNNVMFGIVQSLIELGKMEKHLDWFTQVYKERMKVFCETLEKNLPQGCSFNYPTGGYFVWVKIPMDASPFNKWCLEQGGPGAIPAARFRLSSLTSSYTKDSSVMVGESGDVEHLGVIRLTVAFHDVDTLKIAAEKFCENIKTYMKDVKKF